MFIYYHCSHLLFMFLACNMLVVEDWVSSSVSGNVICEMSRDVSNLTVTYWLYVVWHRVAYFTRSSIELSAWESAHALRDSPTLTDSMAAYSTDTDRFLYLFIILAAVQATHCSGLDWQNIYFVSLSVALDATQLCLNVRNERCTLNNFWING